MKHKIAAMLLLLVLMAFIPFLTNEKNSDNFSTSTKKQISKTNEKEENNSDREYKILCGLTAANYSTDLNFEALKALAIIINTNYSVNPESYDLNDPNVCIYEKNASGKLKEIYPNIKKAVSQIRSTYITYENTPVTIPFSKISNGSTSNSENKEYLCSVASPWDCFNEEYNQSAVCDGVSLYGINHLCSNGESAEQALSWYLPHCQIEELAQN